MPLPTISPRRHPSNSPRRALPGSSPTAATASLAAGLLALLTLALPSPVLADEGFGPDWVEDGDAGNSISTGQRVKGNDSGVNTISGSTSGGGGFVGGSDGGDFQDLYLIFIDDPLAFNASTAGPAGDATFNTRLFLFRIDGRGVLYSDDVSPNDNRSVLKGGKGIPGRGVYGLAIAGTPSLPQTTGGSPMFPFAPPGESVGPTKEGANASLGGWNPAAGDTGSYLLSLTGVRFIPEPCGEGGDCFRPRPEPGCDSLDCCSKICALDPFCCDVSWDFQCANLAVMKCRECGNPAAGPCDSPSPTPYCEDAACCDEVCQIDPTCCFDQWDAGCVALATQICPPPCNDDCPGDFNQDGLRDGGDIGVLLAGWNQPGCTDLDGNGFTDGADLGLLLGLLSPCPSCGDLDGVSCFVPHESPGCADPGCCGRVCDTDPACCEIEWDQNCVTLAANRCAPTCGGRKSGSCTEPHPGPGCNDGECCFQVCEFLPRCCEIAWDQACVQFASQIPECTD